MEVFRRKIGTENNYFLQQWYLVQVFFTLCYKIFFTIDTIPFGYIENVFFSTNLFFLLLQNAYEVNVFCLSTFSHNIYSFWWSMLILPCQCNLRSLFLLSFTFNTSVAAELSSPSKHTVVWPNSVYSIYWVKCSVE